MGLTVQNDSIVMKDGAGNVRFTTDREMPHLLHSVSGSFTVGNVSGTANYQLVVGESSSSSAFTGWTGSNVTRHTAITNSNVITGSDAFVAPFITINGGIFATPAGQTMSALGSNLVNLYIRNDGYFSGSTLINVEIVAGKVELVVRSELNVAGNYTILNHSYNHTAPAAATVGVPSTLNGTSFNVTYKIYYGRFN